MDDKRILLLGDFFVREGDKRMERHVDEKQEERDNIFAAIAFSQRDMGELEKRGFIIRDGEKILVSSEGKVHAKKIVERNRFREALVNSILRTY